MRITNQQIENIQSVLTEVGNKEIDDPVLALKIARNNYNLTQVLNPVLKVKNDILRKYGEKDKMVMLSWMKREESGSWISLNITQKSLH